MTLTATRLGPGAAGRTRRNSPRLSHSGPLSRVEGVVLSTIRTWPGWISQRQQWQRFTHPRARRSSTRERAAWCSGLRRGIFEGVR